MAMDEVLTLGKATKNLAHSLGYTPEAVDEDRARKQLKVEQGYKADAARRANKAEAEWDSAAPLREAQRQLDLIETENKVTGKRISDVYGSWKNDNPVNYYDQTDPDRKAQEFDTFVRENHPELYNPRIIRGIANRGFADDLDRRGKVMETGKILSEQMVESMAGGFVQANNLFYADSVATPKSTTPGRAATMASKNDSANNPDAASNQVLALKSLEESINPTLGRIDPDFQDAFKFTVSSKLAKNGQPLIDVSHPNFVEALTQDGSGKNSNIARTSKTGMTMAEAREYMNGLVQRHGKAIPTAYDANQNERVRSNIARQEKAPVYFSGTTGEFVSGFKSQDANWDWRFTVTGDGGQPQTLQYQGEEDATAALNLYKLSPREHDYLKIQYADWYKNSNGAKPSKAIRRKWAEDIVAMRQASYQKKKTSEKAPKPHDASDVNSKAATMRAKEREMVSDKHPDAGEGLRAEYPSETEYETEMSSALSEYDKITPNKVNSVLRDINKNAIKFSDGDEDAYKETMDVYLNAIKHGVPLDQLHNIFEIDAIPEEELEEKTGVIKKVWDVVTQPASDATRKKWRKLIGLPSAPDA